MYFRYLITFILIFTFLTSNALSVSDKQVEDAIKRLENELAIRDTYINARQARIDSLRHAMHKEKNQQRELELIVRLADEFTPFNNDSAIYYYNHGYYRAKDVGNDSMQTVLQIKRAASLPLAAFIAEAIKSYEMIDTTTIAPSMRPLYHDSGRQMYSYIASFFLSYPLVYDDWNNKSRAAQKQLLNELDPASPQFKLNQGEYFFFNREYNKARSVLMELIDQVPEDDNMNARACHILAEIARARGNTNDYIYYLTLSAISDVKSATLEIMSLQELGEVIFQQGDINRAYNFLSTALENAAKCHASMRMIQSAASLPYIQRSHSAEIDKWRRGMYLIIGLMALTLLVLASTLVYLHKQMKRMRQMHASLQDANRTKEVYISQFLNLCSIYMDKLNQFSKTVNRKIAANQVDDLFKLTKSGKFVEEQSKEFYEVFDNAFLHIYPTFIESVNALMRPEERIELAEGELMNTELRIIAFMRLGIEQSTRIAQILNYSVYTIYTYRNKLRNKAIDRDNFEQDIMKINSIS